MGIALIEAVGIMISSNTAARIFAEALQPALEEHMPGPDGSQLLELTHAALSIPAVCQVNSAHHGNHNSSSAFAQVLRCVAAGTDLAHLLHHAALRAVKIMWQNQPSSSDQGEAFMAPGKNDTDIRLRPLVQAIWLQKCTL